MKKTYSKAELEEKAKAVFKTYADTKRVYATTDGQFFLNKNRANLHAGAKGTVIAIANELEFAEDDTASATSKSKTSKSKTSKSKTSKSKSADALIADALTLETIGAVEAAIVLETEGKNRTTVLAAYNARLEELNTAQ